MQDSNEIISQMGSFASSLVQINETLQALSATDRADHSALRGQLIDSREDLLDTLITLNKMMTMLTTSPDADGRFTVPADDENRPVSIYTGSLLLAPRLFNSSMCFDFAIVVCISGSDAQANSTQRSTASSLLDQSIDVLWVHPQSSYECYSLGISFAESQLRSTTMAIQCWDLQKLHLGQLKEGQRVMYRQHSRMAFFHRIDADKDACRYMASRTDSGAKQPLDPIWIVGEVDHIDSGSGGSEAAVAYVSVPSRACYPNVDGRKASLLYRCKLDGTCLFPLPTANDEVLWRRDPCAGQELSSDSEDDVSDLPMTYRATVRSDPGPPVRPLCRALGDWEQHTRGIGSKILAKMGFSKHAGRGLGRFAQGIVAPVEGLVKPLPVGLSLDFISEEGCSKKSSSSGEDPSDRARDIRADIVSRFNGSHNKSTKAAVSSSRRDKDSKGSRPSDRSVFDFLNTMDANQSRPIGVDSTASSSSSSSSALKKSKVSQSGRSQRLDKLF